MKAAIDAFPFDIDREAPSTKHLRMRLNRAWSARHSAPNHREVVGKLLPDLIRDAQLAVRQADDAADRRAAQAILSEVYSLAQFFVAYQPDSALLWRVAERGMVAAQDSGIRTRSASRHGWPRKPTGTAARSTSTLRTR